VEKERVAAGPSRGTPHNFRSPEVRLFMKYLISMLLLLSAAISQAGNIPMSLAGIELGADVSTVDHCYVPSTDIPLAEERHLNEIDLEAQFVPGIKSGSVAYATCSQKGRIVRIKLKFDNPSRAFYDDLLKRYEKAFGKAHEWRGDPMQTVLSWKWNFKDASGKKVNVELTHSEDEDYKTGNFVKMSYRSLWEEESACLKGSAASGAAGPTKPTPRDKLDYSQLVPR
jgi:hypothetical protein